MEVCYQLPVLPLDRPVPKHILSRRGAISFSSTSSLFGGPDPRKLSQRRGAISYDSADQTALYIRMLGDVRVRKVVGFEPERRGSHPYLRVDYRGLHSLSAEPLSSRGCSCRRPLSFQRHLVVFPSSRCTSSELALCFLDDDYAGQAKCMLRKVGRWNFDIFLFDRLANGNGLATLIAHLFSQYGLIELFQLDVIKLHRFLALIQEDYRSNNPYHNAVHAADVTQAMYCYLQEPQLSSSLTSCDILLGLLAAATHDLDHPGVNQSFLIKTKHHLASLYKNTSVLENHHWRSAVGLLRQSGLLEHLPVEDRQNLEMRLGSLILATDISRQNEYLSQFRSHLKQEDLDLQNTAHRHLVLQMALKCADICNPCRPWKLSKKWSEKVTEEFFCQGDVEKKHGLEVSPLCNRELDTIASVQTGFMSYVVEPLFAEWGHFCSTPLSRTMLSHLGLNKARWREDMRPGTKKNPQENQKS